MAQLMCMLPRRDPQVERLRKKVESSGREITVTAVGFLLGTCLLSWVGGGGAAKSWLVDLGESFLCS